ncbi:MAG: hypothetical protein LBS48_02265 [Treponema sp.]|jgi:hypothetical protein|nr:hypothetical protein [Treponema sp.]
MNLGVLRDGVTGSLAKVREGLKRKPVLFCLGGAVLLLILLIIVVLAAQAGSSGGAGLPEAPGVSVSPEDFFMPQEPDFLPDTLLEREPRRPWTSEDVRPFWKDPADSALKEDWRWEMSRVIDELMESVP